MQLERSNVVWFTLNLPGRIGALQENTNSIRLLNAALVDGYSIVTYQRPLKTNDELDHQILTNGSQAIIWAIGPLNERQEVSFHSDYLKTDRFIDFGRPPVWNCPVPDHEHSQVFADSTDARDSDNQVFYHLWQSQDSLSQPNFDISALLRSLNHFKSTCVLFYCLPVFLSLRRNVRIVADMHDL